jgi:hypothetical protein
MTPATKALRLLACQIGRRRGRFFTGGLALAAVAACGSRVERSEVLDTPPEGLNWEGEGPSFLGTIGGAPGYSGDNPEVLEAQDRFATGTDLHTKVVLRSCGPLSGVCHNQKEYPDIHTPYNFLATIDAPCNIQSGTVEGVFDRCERPGDRLAIEDGKEVEIGYLELVPNLDPEAEVEVAEDMPGLHIHVADPVEIPDRWQQTARFIRTFDDGNTIESLSYARLSTKFHAFEDGRHIVAEVGSNWVKDEVNRLLNVGVEQGDLNQNGTFGARANAEGIVTGPVSLITRGDPETSYIAARMRGHMQGEPVPGSRMPLANAPFSLAEMIAFFCFVEGLPPEGDIQLGSKIDYENCSYSDPAQHEALSLSGVGTGWLDRIRPLLESNCGGCHSSERAEAELILVGEESYDNIISKPAIGDPEGRPFIEPGNPAGSYLFLKLTGDPSIDGDPMPLDPLTGIRTLTDDELAAIETWISEGASP